MIRRHIFAPRQSSRESPLGAESHLQRPRFSTNTPPQPRQGTPLAPVASRGVDTSSSSRGTAHPRSCREHPRQHSVLRRGRTRYRRALRRYDIVRRPETPPWSVPTAIRHEKALPIPIPDAGGGAGVTEGAQIHLSVRTRPPGHNRAVALTWAGQRAGLGSNHGSARRD